MNPFDRVTSILAGIAEGRLASLPIIARREPVAVVRRLEIVRLDIV